METDLMIPPGHTLFAELDLLLSESEIRYPGVHQERDGEGLSDEDAMNSQILAGLVAP